MEDSAVGNSPNISSTEAEKALFSSQIISILLSGVVIFINCENVCLDWLSEMW